MRTYQGIDLDAPIHFGKETKELIQQMDPYPREIIERMLRLLPGLILADTIEPVSGACEAVCFNLHVREFQQAVKDPKAGHWRTRLRAWKGVVFERAPGGPVLALPYESDGDLFRENEAAFHRQLTLHTLERGQTLSVLGAWKANYHIGQHATSKPGDMMLLIHALGMSINLSR